MSQMGLRRAFSPCFYCAKNGMISRSLTSGFFVMRQQNILPDKVGRVFPSSLSLNVAAVGWFVDIRRSIFLNRRTISTCCVRHRQIPVDDIDEKLSVDKSLLRLLEKWEHDLSVDLVLRCANTNNLPNGNTLLLLLQQLSTVGDVDNILRIQDIALQNNILLEKNVYHWTAEAFYNSGRIEESIHTIENIYKEQRQFEDIEFLFTQITYKIIKEFQEKLDIIVNFSEACYKNGDPKAYAAVWKCYMLTERFDDADNLFQTHTNIRPFIATMINQICQNRDKLGVKIEVVLKKLLSVPGLKQRITVLIYEILLDRLALIYSWDEVLSHLQNAKEMDVKLHKTKAFGYINGLMAYYSNGPERTTINNLQIWAENLK